MKNVRLPVALLMLALASAALVWHAIRRLRVSRAHAIRSEQRSASELPSVADDGKPTLLSAAVPAAPVPAAEEKDETEQHLGPFRIAGQNYDVVLERRHLAQNGDVPAVDGVVSMEIVDAAGTVLNQRTFPLWAEEDLHASWSVFAGPLIASNGRGLIVKFGADVEDSARDAPYSQVFGVVDGKLVPFGGPVIATLSTPDADGTYHTVQTANSHTDGLPFVIGTGRFVLSGEVLIDWTQGKLSLPTCADSNVGPTGMCAYKLENPQSYLRRPAQPAFTHLYAVPDEGSSTSKEIAVRANSKLEFLRAGANLELKQLNSLTTPFGANDPMKDQLRVQVVPHSEVWLQVRVDDNEGWLHGEEHLDSIGLREAKDDD
jgi:hypothetical protein